jgi:hypothetical protein
MNTSHIYTIYTYKYIYNIYIYIYIYIYVSEISLLGEQLHV